MTRISRQPDCRAESVRRMDLAEAACKTAIRYPHLSVRALARLFGALQSEVWTALGAARIERPQRNAGDTFGPESIQTDLGAGLSVQAMARKYDVGEREIKASIAPQPLIRREIPKREEKTMDEDLILDRRTPAVAPEPPFTTVVAVIAEADIPDNEPREKRSEQARRKRRPEEMPTKEQIQALLDQGVSRKQIIDRLKLSTGMFYSLLERYGLRGYKSPRVEPRCIGELSVKLKADTTESTAAMNHVHQLLRHPLICFVHEDVLGATAAARINGLLGGLGASEHYSVHLIVREVITNARGGAGMTHPGLFTDEELRPCSECVHEGSAVCPSCRALPCNRNACWVSRYSERGRQFLRGRRRAGSTPTERGRQTSNR